MRAKKDEKVKQDILNAAQELFKQFGLKKTTMDEIASACGKAKSTLYHYFKNKDEVFDEVVMKELHNIRKEVKKAVDNKNSLQEKIKIYLISFHIEAVNKINVFRILQQNRFEEIARFERLQSAIEYEKSYIENLLFDAWDSKEYRGISKKDIPLFAEILVVSFLGLVKYSVLKDQGVELARLSKMADIMVPKIFS